ncbi:uncharacterized protein LOC119114925 [Pollicipes pollicipes]|uniref:uncharacterized protein LOC119114925 n=1 Tax=Pollicipes pollicipes TaxID=41117 RepID=UPI0018853531|nr:uncharacterized protein LOC119114925 [Pollicipes pollicipes]
MAEDECCVEECSLHETDANHAYRFRPVNGTSTSFSVKCHNDAHVCLSPVEYETDSMLQIFIGGWKNSQSGMRLGKDEDVARVDTPDIVCEDEFRTFWVSWDDGHVKVSHGSDMDPFMEWRSSQPLAVGYLGYTTGWGSTGEWKFHDEALFESHCDCPYHFRAVHGSSITFSVQSSNDAHLALTAGPEVSAPMYEIFIGGWSNSKSAIRHTQAIVFGEHMSEDKCMAETPDILSADEMRSFTLTWANGHIKVFIQGDPNPFLAWEDPDPITVTHFGYRTKQGADGKWRFEV